VKNIHRRDAEFFEIEYFLINNPSRGVLLGGEFSSESIQSVAAVYATLRIIFSSQARAAPPAAAGYPKPRPKKPAA
jgi:hypothetical protein